MSATFSRICIALPINLGVSKRIQRRVGAAIRGTLLAAAALVPAHAHAQTSSVTTLSVSASSVSSGTPIKLTASVVIYNSPFVPPGLVVFCDAAATNCLNGNNLAVQSIGGSTASLTVAPAPGKHSYVAVYLGWDVLLSTQQAIPSSTSNTVTVTVTGLRSSTTTLTQDATTSSLLTATVQGIGGTTAPSGVVALNDQTGGTSLSFPSLTGSSLAMGFSSGISLPMQSAGGLLCGDFNNDGKSDILAIDSGGNVLVALSNGDGTFKTLPPAALTSYKTGVSLLAANVNQDNNLDVVVWDSTTVSVLTGNGDGTFSAGWQGSFANVGSVLVSDIDGDGVPDMLVSGTTLTFLSGNPGGSFYSQGSFYSTDYTATGTGAMGTWDVGNPGLMNVVAASPNLAITLSTNGLPLFGNVVSSPTSCPSAQNARFADLNMDGVPDLTCTDTASGTEYFYFGDGTGHFNGAGQVSVASTDPNTPNSPVIAIADVNGDGVPDLVLAQSPFFVLNGTAQGASTFTALKATAVSGVSNFTAMATGDVNADGVADVAGVTVSGGVVVGLGTTGYQGTAQTTYVPQGTGFHTVQAVYPGDANFNSSSSNTLSLQAISTPTLTWVPSPITYGQAASAWETATASVPGTFVYTLGTNTASIPASAVEPMGSYSVTVTFTPTDTTHYSIATQSSIVVVKPAPLTITANDEQTVYGTALPTYTGTVTGTANGDVLTETYSSTATVGSNAGSYAIVPAIGGGAVDNYTVTVKNGTLTISQAASKTALSLGNGNRTWTATVASATTGSPTGSVTFYQGSTAIGTGSLAGGVATYTSSVAPSTNGTYSAQYAGDVNFTASSSPATSLLSAQVQSATVTVVRGGNATDSITATTISGYTGSITFSCADLPDGTTCSYAPQSVTLNGSSSTATSVVTFSTSTTLAALHPSGNGLVTVLACIGLPLFLGVSSVRRRTTAVRMLVAVVALAVFGGFAVGCSGPTKTPTSTGTYNVHVVATMDSGVTQAANVTFTVQ